MSTLYKSFRDKDVCHGTGPKAWTTKAKWGSLLITTEEEMVKQGYRGAAYKIPKESGLRRRRSRLDDSDDTFESDEDTYPIANAPGKAGLAPVDPKTQKGDVEMSAGKDTKDSVADTTGEQEDETTEMIEDMRESIWETIQEMTSQQKEEMWAGANCQLGKKDREIECEKDVWGTAWMCLRYQMENAKRRRIDGHARGLAPMVVPREFVSDIYSSITSGLFTGMENGFEERTETRKGQVKIYKDQMKRLKESANMTNIVLSRSEQYMGRKTKQPGSNGGGGVRKSDEFMATLAQGNARAVRQMLKCYETAFEALIESFEISVTDLRLAAIVHYRMGATDATKKLRAIFNARPTNQSGKAESMTAGVQSQEGDTTGSISAYVDELMTARNLC